MTTPERVTIPLLDALASRHALRSRAKLSLAYTLRKNTAMPSLFSDPSAIVSVSAFNLVAGVHIPPNAVAWRDLTKDGRDLMQNAVNAAAHLKGLKRNQTPTTLPKCDVQFCIETLVNTRTDAAGRKSFVVTGFRPWLLSAIRPANLTAYLAERRDAIENAKKRARDDAAADGESEQQPKKKRKQADGTAVAAEEADEAMPAAAAGPADPNARKFFSPLAIGLMASCQEAKCAGIEMKKARKAAEKRQANKRTAVNPETLPLAARDIDVGSMFAFQYMNTSNMAEFQLRAVNQYTRPRTYALAAMPDEDTVLEPGQIIDPRPFVSYNSQRELDARIAYTNRDHILNPDNIFSKEAAMTYHTHSHEGKRIVCARQTDLSSYAGNGMSHPPPLLLLLLP
jgi:hypothetical protein